MVLIAPSILSADFLNLEREIRLVEKSGADMLHLDIMDGQFVPNMTIGPSIVKQIRAITAMPLDVHLMIRAPERYVEDFAEAGADIITVHAEASIHLHRTLQLIKSLGKKPGVSLNPATPLSHLEYVLSDIHLALIMSVNPGFGGQAFIPQVKEKISSLREMIRARSAGALIEVDGGIKLANCREVAEAGADILVMGSAFFEADDYGDMMLRLRGLLGR
ncbi:MAG: ribulose-phosphate 3-epimerase [Thermodesulfovibrionales bacterium]